MTRTWLLRGPQTHTPTTLRQSKNTPCSATKAPPLSSDLVCLLYVRGVIDADRTECYRYPRSVYRQVHQPGIILGRQCHEWASVTATVRRCSSRPELKTDFFTGTLFLSRFGPADAGPRISPRHPSFLTARPSVINSGIL
jgi:hypothetical protein